MKRLRKPLRWTSYWQWCWTCLLPLPLSLGRQRMQSSGLFMRSSVNELGDSSPFCRLGYFELRDVTLTQQALLDRITKHYIQQVCTYTHLYIEPYIHGIVHTGLLLYSVCIVLQCWGPFRLWYCVVLHLGPCYSTKARQWWCYCVCMYACCAGSHSDVQYCAGSGGLGQSSWLHQRL